MYKLFIKYIASTQLRPNLPSLLLSFFVAKIQPVSRNFVPCWHESVKQLLHIRKLNILDTNLQFPKCILNLILEVFGVQWTHCYGQK